MFRVSQPTKTCPSVCSPTQKMHSTPMRLWISNIPYYWSTIELEKIFSAFGQVYDVEIPLKNGQSRGYGFVTFEKQSDAIRAIQSMDGQIINGRSMQVYQAHVKQKSLLKSYFLIQSFDRSLFGGCCCCKTNSMISTLKSINEAKENNQPRPLHSTDEEIAKITLDFLFAAQDASTIREEQKLLRPDPLAPITTEILTQMKYAWQVMKELLRLRPPATLALHVANQPVEKSSEMN